MTKRGTTQLADMYTAPLHLMKNLIDNALKGAGYGAEPKKTANMVAKLQVSGPLADANTASLNA